MVTSNTHLGDVCLLKAGKFVAAKDIEKEYEEGLFPCYGGNGVRGYVNTYLYDGQFPLIGRQGALCGNVNFATGKFHATEHAIVVTPLRDFNPKWLYYKLVSMNLGQYATGAAQPGLSVTNLEKLPFSFPNKQEQDQFSNNIDLICFLIQKRQQELVKLDQLVKSQFIEQIEPLIECAKTKPLIELVREDRPITYGILKPGVNVDGGVPVVRVKDYPNGKILQNDMLHTTSQIDSKYARSHLLPGDLLLSIGGTIGRMAIVPPELEGANITQHTARLSFSESVLPRYVMGVLEMPMFQHLISGNIKGVAQKGLNLADVKAFQIPVADLNIQKHLVAICEQADKSKFAIQQSLDQLETLKKSLMQEYFDQ